MNSILQDNAPKVRNTKCGDIITAEEENEEGRGKTLEKYTVTDVYHYMVRAMSINHMRVRCFSYGDLVIMGKEFQSDAIEEIRKNSDNLSKVGNRTQYNGKRKVEEQPW